MPLIQSLAVGLLACAVHCLAPAALADSSQPGAFAVSQRTVTVTRASGTTFTAQIRYPASSAAANAPFATAAAPAPAITFGHGFLSAVNLYDSTMDHLASHGYIVIATTSEGSLFPNHANFALDIRQCLTWLEEQNALASSWLVGDVNTAAFGVSGHSMGGGASALAAAADPRIKCLATLAAAETNPSAAAAATSIQLPSCFITGAQDAIVAPSSTLGQYNNCDAPRQFVSIAGGSHCGFVDSAIIACDSGTLPRPDQLAKTRSLLLDWFDAHLRLQSSAFTAAWGVGTPITGTTTTRDARTTLTLGASTLSGAAGTKPLETTITITNIGPDSTAFVLRASSSPFDVSFVPATIAELAAGQSATATVRVASSAAGIASVVIDVVRGRDAAGASAALTVNFTAPPASPADLDHNGVVDAADLATLQSSWGKCAGCAADFDNNGVVDAADLAVLLANWS